MSRLKKIVLVLLVVIVVIQFIQPAHKTSNQVLQVDITKRFSIPTDVQNILKTSCYDCHSNNTKYPWYAYVQPMGWLLAKHIKDGKAELNFSEFGDYTQRRQLSKLKSIANSIKDGSMPLASYTLMHKDARLSNENKELIIEWASKTKVSLETNQSNQ